MTGLYDKNILAAITSLMLQIHSAESYKLGLTSEEEYKRYLADQHEKFEQIIKEVQSND